MVGKTLSHYRILEKLGEGGMGIVYKAEDTRLKRMVALKFLPEHILGDEEGKARFIREAQASASLAHPHICTIYESDEAEGKTFIAMEYIDGHTLDEKIKAGPLKIGEALVIATRIAEGLQEAHERGIVHRDIKSPNIMITKKGQVKIMDFGLAKLSEGTKLTLTATVMGTVAYMSPEQARGDEVDHRTDIWSFGVVLYQMISGQLPFKGENAQAVLYSVMNEEPEPLTALRTGVHVELERIVKKALEKKREDRYQHADEIVTDIRKVQRILEKPVTKEIKPRAIPKSKWFLSPIAISLALIFIAVIVGILVLSPKEGISFEERDWILIADFENTTGNDVFSGALEEALEHEISQSKYVNVIPAERKYDTLRLMKKDPNVQVDEEMAREVALRDGEIRAVLGGSIRQVGKTYSIAIKVINPEDGSTVASYTEIAKGMDDIFYAIRRLANQVREKLGESMAEIGRQESQIPLDWYGKVTTPHLEALKLYRRAMAYANEFNWEKALLFSEQAIEKDPDFAMAYTVAGFMNFNTGRYPEAQRYFDKALQFAGSLTDREKYFIQGGHALIFGNYEKAIEQYSLLVDLYPDDFWGHTNLFDTYALIGYHEKAYEHLKEASRIRPHDPGSLSMLLLFELTVYGNLEKASQIYEQIVQIVPDFDYPHFQFFKPLECWVKGDLEGARSEFQAAIERTQAYSSWSHYGVRMTFVNFEIYIGDFQQGLENIKEMANFYKERQVAHIEGSALFQLSLMNRELGEEKNFKNLMNILYEKFPDPFSSGAAGWLAYNEARAGRMREARMLSDQLKKGSMNEKEKQAFLLLIDGEVTRAEGKFEEAIKNLEEAKKLVTHIIHPPPYFYDPLVTQWTLAEAYEQSNQLDSAIKILQRIVENRLQCFLPGSTMGPFIWIKAHYHLGRLFQKKGEMDSAVEYTRKFLDFWREADKILPEIEDAKRRLSHMTEDD